MQLVIVNCNKCNKESPLIEMTSCSFKGKVTYECSNETTCLSKAKLEKIKLEETEKINKDKRDKYKHLPQIEQLKEMYGIDFDELEELDIRFRDASIHYYCEYNDEFYSWSFGGKHWYQTSFDLRKYI